MALTGIAPPTRLRGLPESTQRQFDAFYEWILRIALGLGFGRVNVFDLSGPSHTLLPNHVGGYLRVSHTAACVLTIPGDSAGFSRGDWFRGIQTGAGALTIVPATGVTINCPETLVMYKQWASFALVNLGSNTWDFDGDAELA